MSPAAADRPLRRHLQPAATVLTVVLLELATGPAQVVIGLLAVTPLAAAVVLGRRETVGYGALALGVAALLGVYTHQYTDEAVVAQLVRFGGIAAATALAVASCSMRLAGEAELARVSAQAATAEAALTLTEVLQRSLLTDPPPIPGLQLQARYLPATRHAQIGGDWYDAFPGRDGSTMLVIGDVAGHDATSAATMAQARGMLRGIAQAVDGGPASVLGAFDRALAGLGMDTLVTAVVATVGPGPAGAGGQRSTVLRWCNAGHPPPVLMGPDGVPRLLSRVPDLLLGVVADVRRTEHELVLGPGDTVLLHTDGLVERRDVLLDDGTLALLGRLRHLSGVPLAELVDGLLTGLLGTVDDDVALLAVRVDD